jgi:hypothetical protein
MTEREAFAAMLTGGHPNSLGRTVEVVDIVLADRDQLEDLFNCYHSDDEIVRLRTSNAMKRVSRAQPTWVIPYIDRFLSEVAEIDQPSAQWTLGQLMLELDEYLTDAQRERAKTVLKHNLTHYDDWIVLNNTIETLATWAQDDPDLLAWLRPHLERLAGDTRKSVAKRANRWLDRL